MCWERFQEFGGSPTKGGRDVNAVLGQNLEICQEADVPRKEALKNLPEPARKRRGYCHHAPLNPSRSRCSRSEQNRPHSSSSTRKNEQALSPRARQPSIPHPKSINVVESHNIKEHKHRSHHPFRHVAPREHRASDGDEEGHHPTQLHRPVVERGRGVEHGEVGRGRSGVGGDGSIRRHSSCLKGEGFIVSRRVWMSSRS